MNKRVVITGMGVISPIGNTIESFKEALFAGKCGITKLELPESDDNRGIAISVAGQVKDFRPEDYGLTPSDIRRSDRFTHFALAATHQDWPHTKRHFVSNVQGFAYVRSAWLRVLCPAWSW